MLRGARADRRRRGAFAAHAGERAALSFVAGVALAAGLAGPAFAADGAALYTQECAKCHGEDGTADTPVGKAMKVPALSGKTESEVVEHVRSSPKHKALSDKLSDDQLAAIATKVAGF